MRRVCPLHLEASAPSGLGNHQQCVQMRMNAVFMPCDLIGAAADVPGLGGSKAS